MLRQDLLENNLEIMSTLIPAIKKYAKDAIIINLAEPVDTLTYYLIKKGGFPKERVLGVSGALDATRLREFIAQELNVSSVDTTALILGGHHDYMLIPPRYARVEGIPIIELMPEERVEALVARTRKAGSEIVSELKRPAGLRSGCLLHDRRTNSGQLEVHFKLQRCDIPFCF